MSSLDSICQRTGACQRVKRGEIVSYLNDGERRVRHLARRCLAVQGLLESIDYLDADMAEDGYRDMTDMQRLHALAMLAEDADTLIKAQMRAALAAVERGEDALALELLQFAAFDDIKRGIQLLSDIPTADALGKAYDAIASRHRPFEPATRGPRKGGPLHVGYVLPNLIDHTNAPSQRIGNLARYHDPERVKMHVYTSEVLTARAKPVYFRKQNAPGTERRAPGLLRLFDERGIPFWATPTDGTLIDMAQALAGKLRDDHLDVIAWQASLACPVECLVADWRCAPVQVNINVGVPMYVEGIDCTTYFMRGNRDREADYFARRGIRTEFIHGGIDLEMTLPPAPTKTAIGLAETHVVLATVGNHLEKRMSDAFCGCIARVLAASPSAVYLVIGGGEFAAQKKWFHDAGVLGRVAFVGPRSDVRHLIRVADVYVNEFPEGGAQSVMEAMASGVPAVAMRWSDRHLHCCGAEYVGPEMTIAGGDLDGYVNMLNRLVGDETFRRERADAARKRVEDLYSFRKCVDRFESLYEALAAEPVAGKL